MDPLNPMAHLWGKKAANLSDLPAGDLAVAGASGMGEEEGAPTPPLRFNEHKCHNNVDLSEDNTVAASSRHAWGGVAGTWVLGAEGVHYFEVQIERARLGFGVYVGVVESSYKQRRMAPR